METSIGISQHLISRVFVRCAFVAWLALGCGTSGSKLAPSSGPQAETSAGGAAGDGGEAGGDAGGSSAGSAGAPGEESLETLPVSRVTLDEDADDGAVIALGGLDTSERTALGDLLILVEKAPRHGSLSDDSGKLPFATRYLSHRDFFGADAFRFVVADLAGHRSKAREVTIEVLPINDAPVAVDDAATTNSLTQIRIDVLGNDRDVDDADLVVVDATQPERGSVALVDDGAALVFMPLHPNSGRETFQYTVSDESGATDVGTVEVNVMDAAVVSIEHFGATPQEVQVGAPIELAWTAVNAIRCDIGGVDSGGAVSGTITLTPSVPTRYTLECAGPGGPVIAQVDVIVLDPAASDTDGDGIPDGIEDLTDTNALDTDSDDDGVPDGVEDANADGGVDAGESDPREPDSDQDGFCDGLRTDGDGDGIEPGSPCLGPVLVNGTNTGAEQDGETWATAYEHLQQGVDGAVPGQAVWVKIGRYYGASANESVLVLRDGIAVYGGFAGSETYLGARDAAERGSVLDGDFLGDDTAVAPLDGDNPNGNPAANRADNSFHVVYGAEGARLDGFSVVHGHAAAPGTITGGGGLLALSPNLSVANTSFIENSAVGSGGGILCADRCDVEVERSTFDGNRAASGGAFAASPTLTQSKGVVTLVELALSRNSALQNGGAIDTRGGVTVNARQIACTGNAAADAGGCWYSQDSRVSLDAGDISGNRASEGGAIHNRRLDFAVRDVSLTNNQAELGGAILVNQGGIEVIGSTLSANTADYGGSMLSFTATVVVEDTDIASSKANSSGGGVYVGTSSVVSFLNVSLSGNEAAYGGGLYVETSTLGSTGSVFLANVSEYGGGMYLGEGANVELDETTLVENSADDYGGGLYAEIASYKLTGAFFGGNSAYTGAGIYQWAECRGSVERAGFVRNRAAFGAGVMVFGPGSFASREVAFVANSGSAGVGLQVDAQDESLTASVRAGSFWRNQATVAGAGLLVMSGAAPTLGDVTFAENECDGCEGGAIQAVGGQPVVTNATFWSNSARLGGAVSGSTHPVTLRASELRLSHASFLDNRATQAGGGVYTRESSTSVVRNSVFWGGGGTDPDIHGEGAGGATVAYVATAQALSGSGNLLLQDDPFELLSPGARLFLNQSRSTPPSVLDAGLDAFADDTEVGFSALGLSPWQELSTAAIGSDDVDTVDLGRHYAPSAGAIDGFTAGASSYSWATSGVDSCFVLNDEDFTVVAIDRDRLGAGTEPLSYSSGTELTLLCYGSFGEPPVAFARVP